MLILLSQHLAWPGAPRGCGFPCPLGLLAPVAPCGLADSVLVLVPCGLLILVPAPQGDGSLYCSWRLRSAPGRMMLHGTLCSERGWEQTGAPCPAGLGYCRPCPAPATCPRPAAAWVQQDAEPSPLAPSPQELAALGRNAPGAGTRCSAGTATAARAACGDGDG